jgi:cellulose/xylan binding protein with CBM9 domain
MTRLLRLGVPVAFAMLHGTAVAPARYHVRATRAPHDALLGRDPRAWQPAAAIDWGSAPYRTTFRALWTARGLYLRFDAADPDPWFTMTTRDDRLWEEEVVEIFLDPSRSGHNYAELEINPGNVVCDVLMREPWPAKRSDLSWQFADLDTRVIPWQRSGKAMGWSALAFIGWRSFATLPSIGGVALPPRAGDWWRFNVFRIERPSGLSRPPAGAIETAWSPPSGPSFHDPLAFRDFVYEPAGAGRDQP